MNDFDRLSHEGLPDLHLPELPDLDAEDFEGPDEDTAYEADRELKYALEKEDEARRVAEEKLQEDYWVSWFLGVVDRGC